MIAWLVASMGAAAAGAGAVDDAVGELLRARWRLAGWHDGRATFVCEGSQTTVALHAESLEVLADLACTLGHPDAAALRAAALRAAAEAAMLAAAASLRDKRVGP